MSKITPTLWYDGTAEEAANFYVTLLPDTASRRSTAHPSIRRRAPRASC